jgi:hypothetical protein
VSKVILGAGPRWRFTCRFVRVVCACVAMPTLACAQAGEGSIAVASLPQDLSPWGMFQDADTIVKAVMIGLAAASLVTWTVWVAKALSFWARAQPCAAVFACSPNPQHSPRT